MQNIDANILRADPPCAAAAEDVFENMPENTPVYSREVLRPQQDILPLLLNLEPVDDEKVHFSCINCSEMFRLMEFRLLRYASQSLLFVLGRVFGISLCAWIK
ncbi:MAG: hypothetical protein GY820_46115 [Gammaproteobacteria bacterium]|nr:hypothetical protein [Gammaproteobacteria bacterium]